MPREVWMSKYSRDKMMLPVRVEIDPECRELVFKMPNGVELAIEIFERHDRGEVCIRSKDGTLLVEPEASNAVSIRVETYEERRKRLV